MKLLDVNVILAAHRDDHPLFADARPCLDDLLDRREPFSVTDLVAGSFVRLATNRRVFAAPTPLPDAFAYLHSLRQQAGHTLLTPGPDHLDVFERLCRAYDASGDLVPDAQLAALAVEYGAEVLTFDRDFARFDAVRWSSPPRSAI